MNEKNPTPKILHHELELRENNPDHQIDLFGVNLSGLELPEINFSGAIFESAILSNCLLKKANFEEANLQGANLKNTYMEGANLAYTNLAYTNFTGAILTDANFDGAKLNGTVFTDAVLDGVYFGKAQLQNTKLQLRQIRNANFEATEFCNVTVIDDSDNPHTVSGDIDSVDDILALIDEGEENTETEVEFINLTQHAVTIKNVAGENVTFLPSGIVARVEQKNQELDPIGGFSLSVATFGDVTGIPEAKKGTYYIVSRLVLSALNGTRPDCVGVGEPIRDGEGRVIGAIGFSR